MHIRAYLSSSSTFWVYTNYLCIYPVIQKEHSIENLVTILNKIASDLKNASNTTLEDGNDGSVGSNEPAYGICENDLSADDRWFILCSRPHGSVTLIPTLFAVAGFCCSSIGSRLCSLFFRELIEGNFYFTSADGVLEDITGLSIGLYSYGVEYNDAGFDVLQCSATIPVDFKGDVYIKLARSFAAIGQIVGVPATFLLCLSNCMVLSRKVFRRNAVTLFIVAFCESMVFVFLLSERCNMDLLPSAPGIEFQRCRLSSGSTLYVVGSAMWFLAAVFATYIDTASLVEQRLKMYSMHVMEQYQ